MIILSSYRLLKQPSDFFESVCVCLSYQKDVGLGSVKSPVLLPSILTI
jgi:hypothetical protein